MEKRLFKVQGWGTGTAALTAELDGEIVFSGDVELTAFSDETGSYKTAPTLFTFELPIEFGGTKSMKIKVEKSAVRFGQVVANYTEVDWGEYYFTGPYEFADVALRHDSGSRDPRQNVRIDDVAQTVDRQGLMGTWHWNINPGSTFEHDLVISEGSEMAF